MKILQFPAYITINNDNDFNRSITGYGYMTLDIATSIAVSEVEVDLITQSNITKGLVYKQVNILKRTWYNVLSNLKFSHFLSVLKIILKDRISLKRIPNVVMYYISMGYFEKVIKTNNYDLIHIHGIGYYTIPIIETCKKNKVKFLVTLHGLNAFSDSINITEREKEIEKDFLKMAEVDDIPVTVISTGIRHTVLNYLENPNSTNFTVITNGCLIKIEDTTARINIRKKYCIEADVKIILCVGNIGKRKNQIQVVKAFSKLPDSKKKQLAILFLGSDMTNGTFTNSIKKIGLSSHLIACGNIPKNNLSDFYKQADFNIVASISEGFGLSIIEGFVYGLPCLTFNDLDAVSDLFSKRSMITIMERTDEALAKGITQMTNKKWNKQIIQLHSQNFSLEQMAQKYIQSYKKSINN